ncbi:MAG: iron chelate uptake ABC transporter family permease subunit [Planctomycetota bacterium]
MISLWPADWSWTPDGWIIVAGILCAVSAALLGNFLVLRKLSLLGDAISHAVLPGLAIAFLVTSSRSSWPMFVGAVIAGLVTAGATQWIRQAGKVDESASLGVVFTCLFALGLVLIVQAADRVDLDPGCVLYGAIETTALDKVELWGVQLPRVIWVLGAVLCVNVLAVLLLYKELKLSSFDPALATSLGISANLMHALLMILVAITAVASFESVGNILVVAMLVVPPSAALLITDRMARVILWSALIAAGSAVLGHWLATVVPGALGYRSTSTAAMMAVASGWLFCLALIFGPNQGLLWRWWRLRTTAFNVLAEDLIGLLYRREEKATETGQAVLPLSGEASELAKLLETKQGIVRRVKSGLMKRGLVHQTAGRLELTEAGRQEAQRLVRAHRLWEQYLVERAEIPLSRIHVHAEQFEHYTSASMRDRLAEQTEGTDVDPHGSPIPPEQ